MGSAVVELGNNFATTEAGKLLPADLRAVYEVVWQGLSSSDVETGSDIDSDALWSLADPWVLGMVAEEDVDISSFEEDFEPFSVNGVGVRIDDQPYNRALVFSTDRGVLSVQSTTRRASASYRQYEGQPGPPLISLGLAYNADFPSLNVRLPKDVDELLSIVDDIVASVEASSADSWPNLELNELVKVTLSMQSPPDDWIEIRTGSEGFKMYIENRDLLVCISKGSEIAQSTANGSSCELDSGAISDLKYMANMLEIYRSELDGTIDGGIKELNRFLENPRIPAVELVDELPPPEWSWTAKMEKYMDK